MNVIFTIFTTLSLIVLTLTAPEKGLEIAVNGAEKSIALGLNLLSIYAVWNGFLQVAEDSGIISKFSSLLKPLIRRAFKTNDEKTEGLIAVNLSANLLGMGGIATPSGIDATTNLTSCGNHDGASLLFILSATSIQLLPTTVISLRQSFNSSSPFDIILPCLITTVFSSLCGVLLYFLTTRRKGVK